MAILQDTSIDRPSAVPRWFLTSVIVLTLVLVVRGGVSRLMIGPIAPAVFIAWVAGSTVRSCTGTIRRAAAPRGAAT